MMPCLAEYLRDTESLPGLAVSALLFKNVSGVAPLSERLIAVASPLLSEFVREMGSSTANPSMFSPAVLGPA
jgi:hypothetical protein